MRCRRREYVSVRIQAFTRSRRGIARYGGALRSHAFQQRRARESLCAKKKSPREETPLFPRLMSPHQARPMNSEAICARFHRLSMSLTATTRETYRQVYVSSTQRPLRAPMKRYGAYERVRSPNVATPSALPSSFSHATRPPSPACPAPVTTSRFAACWS